MHDRRKEGISSLRNVVNNRGIGDDVELREACDEQREHCKHSFLAKYMRVPGEKLLALGRDKE